MKLHLKLALAMGALALAAVPAAAMAVSYEPIYNPAPHPEHPQGPPAHAKAYGFHCKGLSKKHEKGKKGTPFSLCVKALAQANRNDNLAPGRACRAESKKHEKGKEGTPFSRCVKGVVAMRKEHRELGLS